MTKNALIEKWSDELVQKLHRPARNIIERGLSATDFHEQVEIKFQDGSYALFNYAFFVVNQSSKTCAIFTEHCGYFEFSSAAVMVKETPDSYFIDELYEEF